MEAFLAVSGWCFILWGALIVVISLASGEINIARETEAILALGFGVVALGLFAVLRALAKQSARREQLPPTLRDPIPPEGHDPPPTGTKNIAEPNPTPFVWTGKQWKILRPFFGPKIQR
jgi:hypothetical protein